MFQSRIGFSPLLRSKMPSVSARLAELMLAPVPGCESVRLVPSTLADDARLQVLASKQAPPPSRYISTFFELLLRLTLRPAGEPSRHLVSGNSMYVQVRSGAVRGL